MQRRHNLCSTFFSVYLLGLSQTYGAAFQDILLFIIVIRCFQYIYISIYFTHTKSEINLPSPDYFASKIHGSATRSCLRPCDLVPQVQQPHAGHESRQGAAALSQQLQINDNYHLDMSTLITEQDQGQGPEPRWP